ncbi:MAG TPA: right-handed parallel beta-helix repeat-containing protein, partial [Streptosporangiaceae bacterium]|nr:right-handed parallel beta-helix repeat-containing protein [Streptosporangiaceae bacterium]
QPFCTIAAAAKEAAAGDTVLVRAGTYTGTSVNPANSGTAGGPITFTASPGVTISGGTRAFALSGRSYIVVSGFSISGTSSAGISVSGGGNDTISGNTITGTSSYGISVSASSNDTVSGNNESFAGHPVSGQAAAGFYLSGLAGGLIKDNITHDNSAHGIYLTGSSTGVTVEGNISYHNAYQYQRNANGIDDIAPGNIITGNTTYANEDTGINIYSGGNSALVADNLSYGNGDHGIDDLNVTGGRIIGNTVFGNCTDGINVEGTSGNYDVENNISVNNATGAQVNPTPISPGAPANICKNRRTGNIGIYDSAPASTTVNYNLVWQGGSGVEYMWAGTAYNSPAALNQAAGQEANGLVADPNFVTAATGNFQLTQGSPAIDSANSAASGEQGTDVLGNPRVDDPAVANSGAGPRAYDDRGAYEYQSSGTRAGPDAVLTVAPAAGTAPVSVTADASASTAGSSPITSYSFSFGDGTSAGPQAAATASHTYAAAGAYTVTVTVTDGDNLSEQATQTVTVSTQASQPAKYISQIATNYSMVSHTSGSVTVWRPAGVTAGDLIIATVRLTGSSSGAVSGTDSKADTLRVVSDIGDGQGDRLVTLSGISSGLAASDQVILSFPAASSYRITADEVSGVTAADQVSIASGSTSMFSSGATSATSRAGEFAYAAVATFGGTSLSWASGWTGETTYSAGSNALGRAYQIPASAGQFTASGTASGTWLAEIVTFT